MEAAGFSKVVNFMMTKLVIQIGLSKLDYPNSINILEPRCESDFIVHIGEPKVFILAIER